MYDTQMDFMLDHAKNDCLGMNKIYIYFL